MLGRLGFAVAILAGLFVQPAFAKSKIFVASSLVDVVQKLVEVSAIEDLNVVVGSSSSLGRQIKAGAPADLFISAHKDWAEYVADQHKPLPLFSNRLVLISHQNTRLDDIAELPNLLQNQRLAMGDPTHVPAGLYAKDALEHLGIWELLKEQIAPSDNVRGAARLVQNGATPFGIVYASDAKLLDLNVAFEFAANSHEPIIYWAVPLRPDNSEISAFMQFLGSEDARAIVASYGFLPLEGQ